MKKIDLGQAVGILANVGVILGIVFLGIELRQNNESIDATVRASRAASSQAVFSPFFQSPELADVFARATGDEAESVLLNAYLQHTLIGWEYRWREYRAGALSEDDLPIQVWVNSIARNPVIESVWAQVRGGEVYNPEFIEYIDSHLKEFRESQ